MLTVFSRLLDKMLEQTRKWHIALLLGVMSSSSFAASGKDLSSMASTVTTQLKALKDPIMIIAAIAGLVFAVIGIMEFKNLGDPQARGQASAGKAIMNLVIGVALLSMSYWLYSTFKTVTGDEASFTISP